MSSRKCSLTKTRKSRVTQFKKSHPYNPPKNENPGTDDDEFRFNDASTHEGHLRQNGKLTWFCNETAIKVSYICIKCKTRTNLKIKAVRLCL